MTLWKSEGIDLYRCSFPEQNLVINHLHCDLTISFMALGKNDRQNCYVSLTNKIIKYSEKTDILKYMI